MSEMPLAALHHAIGTWTVPAFRPFLEPAPIENYWMWLLFPLILIIAIVYRTIKSDDLKRLPQQAGYLAMQISVFMVLAGALLWGLFLIF